MMRNRSKRDTTEYREHKLAALRAVGRFVVLRGNWWILVEASAKEVA